MQPLAELKTRQTYTKRKKFSTCTDPGKIFHQVLPKKALAKVQSLLESAVIEPLNQFRTTGYFYS